MVKDMKTAVKSTVHTLLHFQLGRNKFEPLTTVSINLVEYTATQW